MTRLSRVAAAVYNRPWHIIPEQLDVIGELVQFHLEGGRLSQVELAERLQAAQAVAGPRRGARTSGSVAIIPIYGTIFPRANLMTDFSGGATCAGIRVAFREAMADEAVGSILLDVDSPGGYTDGLEELATEIRSARGTKPIVAIANYTMASAAYYLGSQADEVVASPSSMVGWVGTVLVHQEFSKADELEGVTTTVVRNPARKLEVNSFEPLTPEALAQLQEMVDDGTSQFVTAVSKGRGVSTATVMGDFGQGTGMTAQRAKAAGLVDRVETIDDTIRRLATGRVVPRGTSASGGVRIENLDADGNPMTAEEAIASLADHEPVEEPDRTKEAEAALALARARAR